MCSIAIDGVLFEFRKPPPTPSFPRVLVQNLAMLALPDNRLEELPVGVANLGSLTRLDLTCNRLLELPFLGTLASLAELLIR